MKNPKWQFKIYHNLILFLPVILMLSLIMIVYTTYFFTYLLPLINNEFHLNPDSLTYSDTRSKGIILLTITTILIIGLLIAFFRTIFINPGYFPSPLELEFKVIQKEISKKEISVEKKEGKMLNLIKKEDSNLLYHKNTLNYLTNFDRTLVDGPLSLTETIEVRKTLESFIPKTDTGYSALDFGKNLYSWTNDEVLEKNKRLFMSKYGEAIQKQSFFNDIICNKPDFPNSKEIFLDVWTGIDLSKTNLCGTCLRLKVERSHHCRQCGRCVLKMDHHCPWLANCIGFYNYKYFCLIHLYGTLASFIIGITYWECLIRDNISYDSDIWKCFISFFAYVANIGLFSFLTWLFCVNIKLVFDGQTIIEQSDQERFPSSKATNQYDMGWRRNFVNIFGQNPFVWFLPFFPNYKGGGFVYETHGFIMY